MEWRLTPTKDSLIVMKFVKARFIQDGPPIHVIGLLRGIMFRDIPAGENFSMARTFQNKFVTQLQTLGLQVGFTQELRTGGLY